MLDLYPYQVEAVEAAMSSLKRDGSALLVMPTGTGKTVVFSAIARRYVKRGGRVLVLAHRRELIQQAERIATLSGLTAGVEQGSRFAARHADVVVASVQTMQDARLRLREPDEFSLIIVDEAHHAPATSYRKVLNHFGAHRLGVTATPDRLDGAGLGTVFKGIAFRMSLLDAVKNGHLCNMLGRRVVLKDVDLSGVRIVAGDLSAKDLAKIMEQERTVHGVSVPLLELAGARKTVVFTTSVAQAQAIAELLNRARPGCALAVDGMAPQAERDNAVRGLRDGRFQFLVNCNLYTEGFDEPSVECVAIARPTRSRALFTQMVGRGLRKHHGKTDCLVLDFTSNSSEHDLVGPADVLAERSLTKAERAQAQDAMSDTSDVGAIVDRMQSEATVVFKTEEVAVAVPPSVASSSEYAIRRLEDKGMRRASKRRSDNRVSRRRETKPIDRDWKTDGSTKWRVGHIGSGRSAFETAASGLLSKYRA